MPTGCCGGGACGCRLTVQDGSRLSLEGSGSANDPFLLDLEAEFQDAHNQTFDTNQTGAGTADDPWIIETTFAPTAKLDHLPDVNAAAPTNGQVLSWNTATNQWVPTAPTVAPTGAVLHDTSMSGDGSAATPLGITPSVTRLIGTFSTGVGLNDQGMLSVVQHFQNSTARATAIPAPSLNQLTMLDTNPGMVDYWDGTVWTPQRNQVTWSLSDEFLVLSGDYLGGAVQVQSLQVTATTDANGVFDVLAPSVLTGRSGVLSLGITELGSTPWKAMPYANTDRVSATAYRLTDGTAMAGSSITLSVMFITY